MSSARSECSTQKPTCAAAWLLEWHDCRCLKPTHIMQCFHLHIKNLHRLCMLFRIQDFFLFHDFSTSLVASSYQSSAATHCRAWNYPSANKSIKWKATLRKALYLTDLVDHAPSLRPMLFDGYKTAVQKLQRTYCCLHPGWRAPHSLEAFESELRTFSIDSMAIWGFWY